MAEALIRAAVTTDVPAIQAVVRDAYGKYVARLGKAPAPMNANYRHHVDQGDVWVIVCMGDVAGLIVLRSKPDHLLISNLAVASLYQGHRFGSRLLAFADVEARRRGYGELRLFTHELMHENLAIYTRLGWSEYDRAEQDGYRRVFMRKRLSDR